MWNLIARLVLIPARIKGLRVSKDVVLAPGYDWITTSWKGVTLEQGVHIGRRAWIQCVDNNSGRILIKKGTSIGRDVVISSADNITIGQHCLISYRVSILDHEHKFELGKSPVGTEIGSIDEIEIGDRCFIGSNVTILKGVILGDDCIVAANSVLTHSFPQYSVIGGVPAKLMSRRNN